MTIKKFHTKGTPPLEQPIAGLAIEARLREEEARRSAEHAANRHATPARLRASDAYKCARQIAYRSLGVPPDVTYDAQQLMTFRAGDFYHSVVQAAVAETLKARIEVDFDLRPEWDLYGKCDYVFEHDGDVVAGEIKSQAGYGFDLATGAKKSSDGPGPKLDHLLQVGMAATSPQIDAAYVHVVYISKDRGVVAEWMLGLDEELRHLEDRTLRDLVEEELQRTVLVLASLDAGVIPARDVPGHGLVVGEPPAAYTRDDPWTCRYCSWQPSCALQPADAFGFQLDVDKRVLDEAGWDFDAASIKAESREEAEAVALADRKHLSECLYVAHPEYGRCTCRDDSPDWTLARISRGSSNAACTKCGTTENVVFAEDPYLGELWDDRTPVHMCRSCRGQRAGDV